MPGVAFDLGAQAIDVGVHGVLVALELVAPDEVEQIGAAVGPAGIAGKQGKKLELLHGERKGRPSPGDLALGEVQRDVADLHQLLPRGRHRRLAVRLHTAQERLHPGDQLADAEGLCHVIVGADLQAEHPVDLLRFCREHQDRGGGVLFPDSGADGKTVHLRQHQVQDDQGIRPFQRLLEPGPPVRRPFGLQPQVTKVHRHHLRDVLVVFYYECFLRHRHPFTPFVEYTNRAAMPDTRSARTYARLFCPRTPAGVVTNSGVYRSRNTKWLVFDTHLETIETVGAQSVSLS